MTNAKDFSLDCETLSLEHDAAILSIGCAQFDLDTGDIGEVFYRKVNLDTALRSGKISGDTLGWWLSQPEEARQVFVKDENTHPLQVVLHELYTWTQRLTREPVYWFNGPAEDATWIKAAIRNGTLAVPMAWLYHAARDMRTIVDVATMLAGFNIGDCDRIGTYHNALDDAVSQAKVISSAYQYLKLGHTHAAVARNPAPKRTAAKAAPPPPPAPADDDDDL